MGFLLPIFLLAAGIYVLVGAIKGSGRLFSMENFKDESIPKAKKALRLIYIALAVIMLITALTSGVQTALYSGKLTYYRVTDAYKTTFADLLEDGELTYTTTAAASGGMSCLGSASTGQEITYGPYSVDNQKMEIEEISAFINKAYNAYSEDREKFPLSSGGMMSCMGGSVDYSKYYEQTDLIDDAGEPVYPMTEADLEKGHSVWVSSPGNVRSDANDGSFISKLYEITDPTVLQILNYVFLGLAVAALVVLFIVTRKFTDKEKLQKAREEQVHGPSMPSSAFNFDDEEPEQTEKK